jgi:hypothetical protein
MRRRNFIAALVGGIGSVVASRHVSARRATVLLQESPVAGFEFYRGEAIWPSLRVGKPLSLVREAANAYDRDAVAVYVGGNQLGYVPQLENRAIAQMLDRGERLEARIVELHDDGHPWNRVRMSISLA